MSKNVQNTILPLSITVPSSRGSACMPYQSGNKKKQPLSVYSKIVKQPQKKDKQKQKSKQNTNISIKTMQNSIQNLRSVLQKKQDNKDQHACLSKDKIISQRPKIPRNQYAAANSTKHKCCIDKKIKNVSNKSSESLGKIKITNNPTTHSKTNDNQIKYKSTTGTNFTKYGKLEKFIKQANKKTNMYSQKQEKQQMPVINIDIQFSEKLEEEPNMETKNRSIIQTLQQPTNFIDQSWKNSPVPYRYEQKQGKLTENYQTLSKKCQSERKMKRYHYLQSVPTQIVNETQKNTFTKQQPKEQQIKHKTLLKPTKNTYQNFRLKRSQENSMNQLSQKNSINDGLINKTKKLQESHQTNKYPIATNKFHSATSQPFRNINEKSNNLLKNNGSFTHILGYMDKANRSRQRSLESRSRGSIRQHSIEFDLNKFENRSKQKFYNAQTSKSRHKLKYNYLQQVEVEKEKDRQKDRLKQKQRELLQRQRKVMEKEKDIQRKKRRQFVEIEKQREREQHIQNQRERERQREKEKEKERKRIEELEHKLRKTKQVQRQIQRRRDSQRQRVEIKNTRQIYSHTNSPLKNELTSNNSLKYLNFNQSIKDGRTFNYLPSQQSTNRNQNTRSTQKIIFSKPLQQVNALNSKNFSTPFKSTTQFKIDQASYQSPIDYLQLPQANQNYGSVRTNILQKQCICKHQCQCKNLTGELNTSRLNRINNKLQQYIAKNMKSGRDCNQYGRYY